MDVLLLTALIASFAILVTSHLTLAIGLLRRPPWWRGLVCLVLLPLAVYWGFAEQMRVRVAFWCGALAIYALSWAAISVSP